MYLHIKSVRRLSH